MKAARKSKVVSLSEAASLVKEGSSLAVGGYSMVRKPSAFIREIVKKRIGNLTLLSNISSYDTDLLVGAHLVKKAYLCHVTFEYLGLAPNFRRAVEVGEIEMIECDASLLVAGYLATALVERPMARLLSGAPEAGRSEREP